MKKYILASIITFCISLLHGQWAGSEKFLPQTPEAAAINRYGDIPVDGSSGVPSIGLPIYTLSEGNLSLPISLSYHAGGMKASDQATWVGMGWTLSAGGMISRSVNGMPDENPFPKTHINQTKGWYSDRGSQVFLNVSEGGYDYPATNSFIDTEPDLFNFNIPGYSGKFYFDNNRNIVVVPRQDLEIYVRYDSTGTERQFNGFWIVAPDGSEYHFAKTYKSDVIVADFIENIKVTNFTVDGYAPNNTRATWLLSKIYSADGKDSISLAYVSQKYSYWNLGYKPSATILTNPSSPSVSGSLVPTDTKTQTDIDGKRITSITGSNNTVSFVADAATRTDLAKYSSQGSGLNIEAKGLSEIIVQDKQSQCVLKTQFFKSTISSSTTTGVSSLPSDDSDRNRLYLDSVRMVDCSTSQTLTHGFEYNNRGSVQRKLTYGQDYWGFMNGDASKSDLEPGDGFIETDCYSAYSGTGDHCPTKLRDPNLTATQNGILKKMIYPTGGWTEFTYELNEAVDNKTTCSETILFANQWGSGSCASYLLGPQNSVYLSANDVSNGYLELKVFECSGSPGKVYVKTSGGANVFTASAPSTVKLSTTGISPSGGTYILQPETDGARFTYVIYKKNITSGVQNVPIGGLRIKTLQTKDGSGTIANTKTYNYNESSTLSTGKPVYRPKYLQVFHNQDGAAWTLYKYVSGSYVSHSGSVYFKNPETGSFGSPIASGTNFKYKWLSNNLISCVNGTTAYYEIPYYYLTNSGSTAITNKVFARRNFQLLTHQFDGPPGTSIQGNHIAYQKVAVTESDNGSTIRYFDLGSYATGPADPKGYPLIPAKFEPNLGNLTTEEIYDDLGNILSSTAFTYTTKIDTVVPYGYYSPVKSISLSSTVFGTQFYALETGYSLLSSKTDKIYDPSSAANFLSTVTNYTYNTQNSHYQKASEAITNSDGVVYKTEYKYSKDFPCPSGCTSSNAEMDAILSMRKKNMVDSPIEVVKSYKLPTSGTYYVYDATYTKMDKIGGSTSHVKPGAVYQFLTNNPTSSFTYSSGTASSFTKHTGYTQEYNFAYDVNSGKLISQWKQNDPSKIQYIWAHGYKKPVAKVLNAESSEIAYTGFENISSVELGGWTISGTTGGTSTAAGNFVTGASGYNLTSSRTISKAALPSGTYLLSFFHRNGIVSVNGVTASTNTGSTWKYVEYKVTITGGSVSITGSASYPSQYIDELRLIPADAQMTSFNYHAGSLLPTSINDVNSISNHFEYDGLWRLKTIFDNDRYVKQAFLYDYKLGTNVNRIRSYKTNTTTTSHTSAIALTGANVERNFQFFDGLGRSVQSVGVALSPTSFDVISNTTYDLAHRALKVYLPYTESSNGGTYRSSWLTTQTNFVNAYDGNTSGYGYSETKYEKSPLGRPVEMGQPTDALRIGNGHTHEIKYRLNTTSDNVRDFLNNNFYAANTLTVEEHTDENEAKSWIFKDKLGRVVLEKKQVALSPTVENDHYARTYTIYDNFGRTAYVLPPETSKKMATSSNWTHTGATYTGMVYKYSYDSRGRLSDKKIPGKNSELITYDRLDRPVLATTALGHKIFTKYDILGRAVLTGIYTGTAGPTGTESLYESETSNVPNHGYTNIAFPLSSFTIHNVSYYDHYDFDRNGSISGLEAYTNPGTGYSSAPYGRSRGQMTGGKVGVLVGNTTTPSTYLTSSNFYDDEYALIQTKTDNHIGGTDISSSAYDFAGRVTKQNRVHSSTTVSAFTTEYAFGYDHASRPLYTTIKVGSDPVKILNKFKYDELGRLTEKNLHSNSGTDPTMAADFTQSIDFTYNLLGWNSKINELYYANQGGDVNVDLFMSNLEFDYLGNIVAPSWNVNKTGFSIGNAKQYRIGYDAANRDTAATYWTLNTSWVWTNDNHYTENDVQYDLNGNIKALKRQGLLSGTTFGNMDNLTYTYDANIPDRLTRVQDSYSATKGFIQGSTATTTYTYDNAGNMITDAHKGLTINYNFLNLPAVITKSIQNISFAYTTTGVKLTKYVGGAVSRQYVGGIEYDNTTLAAIYTPEGRVIPNGASWHYEYSIKDHLGNVRVNFRANTSTTAYTFLDEHHYYPFGLEQEGSTFGGGDKYRYNGKEFNEDLGLNWNDYGARWYDPAIGRFGSVDRFAAKYADMTPYQYAANNPIRFIDVNGDSIKIAVGDGKFAYYDNGNVVNADGSQYSGKGVKTSKDGTVKLTGNLKRTVNALNQIVNGGTAGQELISGLINSSKAVTIYPADENQADGLTVKFNASSTEGGLNQDGSNFRPAFVGLAHELVHAAEFASKTIDYSTWFTTPEGKKVRKAEISASNYENRIRAENGLSLRAYYTTSVYPDAALLNGSTAKNPTPYKALDPIPSRIIMSVTSNSKP